MSHISVIYNNKTEECITDEVSLLIENVRLFLLPVISLIGTIFGLSTFIISIILKADGNGACRSLVLSLFLCTAIINFINLVKSLTASHALTQCNIHSDKMKSELRLYFPIYTMLRQMSYLSWAYITFNLVIAMRSKKKQFEYLNEKHPIIITCITLFNILPLFTFTNFQIILCSSHCDFQIINYQAFTTYCFILEGSMTVISIVAIFYSLTLFLSPRPLKRNRLYLLEIEIAPLSRKLLAKTVYCLIIKVVENLIHLTNITFIHFQQQYYRDLDIAKSNVYPMSLLQCAIVVYDMFTPLITLTVFVYRPFSVPTWYSFLNGKMVKSARKKAKAEENNE